MTSNNTAIQEIADKSAESFNGGGSTLSFNQFGTRDNVVGIGGDLSLVSTGVIKLF
jgi:hypothetical protein